MQSKFNIDKERRIDRNLGWNEFKSFIAEQNADLDTDVILRKPNSKKDPVVSYGIIEFVQYKNYVKYHMFRRRNTMEYDIIIRGFAQSNNLFEMICLLSDDEKQRIRDNELIDLWDDYWIDHNSPGYTKLWNQAERKFPQTKNLLIKLWDKIGNKIMKRPLVFPKGKPNEGETEKETALREAKEETKDSFTDGGFYFMNPVSQHFIGSNGRKYICHYYIWKRTKTYKCTKLRLGCSIQRKSITGLKPICLSFDDSYSESEIKKPRLNSNGQDNHSGFRLRSETISHELENDIWITIPVFNNIKDQWEWKNSVDPYLELGIYKRYFDTIMEIHSHLDFST